MELFIPQNHVVITCPQAYFKVLFIGLIQFVELD